MQCRSKPTMFQVMCGSTAIYDIYEWFATLNDEHKSIMRGHLRGQLGSSMYISELHSSGITTDTIGSVSFKINYEGRTLSVLIFKNGKIKISGGFPEALLSCRDSTTMDDYIYKVVSAIQEVTKLEICDTKLSCLNGQLSTAMFKDVAQLTMFIKSKSHLFSKVKPPDFDIPGRRGAFKLYLHKTRKTHIAIDIKGKSQIFAATSFEELFHLFEILT